MKVFFDSVGCRLNQSEIEQYALQFRSAGHTVVASAAEADLVVINTCAVTAEAASDSRQKARQAARALQDGGEIVLTGCWSTLDPGGALALPKVRRAVPNLRKDHLAAEVLGEEVYELEPVARQPLPGLHQRTRAFLKVQDGCDNHCTFCVTRIARGAGRSRSIEEVLADVRTAAAGGSKEIVLTGVHLGSWGQDFPQPARLDELVRRLLAEGGFERLRLSSLEPWDLDEPFFSLWKDARLCRHLHLPLQSGSLGTLRRMAHKTTPELFSGLVAQARAACEDMAVTTDVIVGFPGETEAEFQESLEFVRQMEFAGGHVFSYSPRAGTAAMRMAGQVPTEAKKERSFEMRRVLAEAEGRYYARFLGSTEGVLWEATDGLSQEGWRLHGLSDNYLRVSATSPERIWNQISRVRLERLGDKGLEGSIQAG